MRRLACLDSEDGDLLGAGILPGGLGYLVEEVAAGRLAPEQVTADAFRAHLWTGDLPDPDLVIRTSGEVRISNFLLWQSAYAEFVIEPIAWPDWTEADFDNCLVQIAGRDRRYGGVAP